MDKKTKNISDLLKAVGVDKNVREAAENEIKKRSLAKFLFTLRCNHNLTQKQLAEKIGCTQSKLSKLESAYDSDITVQDLLNYAKALNLQLEIGYRSKHIKIMDLIKYHAFKIKMYLEHLSKLAQKDETLDESIGQFHDEVLFNMIKFIVDSVSKLNFAKKKFSPKKKEQIHISPPFDTRNTEKNNKYLTSHST